MQCPDCKGEMWDNRASKRKPTQPDYKCKNKEGCGKSVWLEKKDGTPNVPASNGNGATRQAGRPLGPLYNECLEFAKRAMGHHFGEDVATADIVAATATLFIQAARDGHPIRAAKVAPPPPPPPPPKPDPDSFPTALIDKDDDLPF